MSTRRLLPLTMASIALLVVGLYAVSREKPAESKKPAAPETKAEAPEGKTEKADREALWKSSREFVRAFKKGDAKAVAGFWTKQGEYVTEDGRTIRGRAALEKAYRKFFAKSPTVDLDVTVESIRFVSRDSAIEEGLARVRKGKDEQPTTSRYSVLHVREDGRWLMAMLREWPDEGVTLKDLAWLIGTGVGKSADGEVRTTYRWDDSKKFIRATFTVKTKDNTLTGTQMIGIDPRTSGVRSWLFESEGGIGEATWSQDGKRWLVEASGTQADGSEMAATNILTPIDKDSFTWQSMNRELEGEELPNIPPIKVTRVK